MREVPAVPVTRRRQVTGTRGLLGNPMNALVEDMMVGEMPNKSERIQLKVKETKEMPNI